MSSGATLRFDAVILAGGRSSRLGGEPKANLVIGQEPLLVRALRAAEGAVHTAVAGPASLRGLLAAADFSGLLVREDPPFSGPAAAVGAALTALGEPAAGTAGHPGPSPWTLVLACDMPQAHEAVPALLAAAELDPAKSVLAVDAGGKTQPLAALYRTGDLAAAVDARAGGLANLSMFSMLARVQWREVAVPEGSTADVDTWADAGKWGIQTGPRAAAPPGPAAAAKD
ncbi:MAG: NTP transferase domain-containing protein [Arthrobacter sp.]